MSPVSEVIAGLGKPVAELVKNIGGIIDNVTTTDEERLKAANEANEALQKFHVQVAGVMVSEAAIRAEVVKTEATSQSWLTRNWRPITALSFTGMVIYNYFLGLMFGLKTVDVPDHAWTLLSIMVGGYTFARSAEKILPKLKSK